MELKVGQIWRGDDGYLYRLVAEDKADPENYIWARHPNAGVHGQMYRIQRAWFTQPDWHMTSEAA